MDAGMGCWQCCTKILSYCRVACLRAWPKEYDDGGNAEGAREIYTLVVAMLVKLIWTQRVRRPIGI